MQDLSSKDAAGDAVLKDEGDAAGMLLGKMEGWSCTRTQGKHCIVVGGGGAACTPVNQ